MLESRVELQRRVAGEWQFWQRGCCSTVLTVSNAARPSFSETDGGGADHVAAERASAAEAIARSIAARLTRASAGAGAAASRSRRRGRWRRRARSAARPARRCRPIFSSLGTMCTSTCGISYMRSGRVVVEVALLDAAVLERDLRRGARPRGRTRWPPCDLRVDPEGLTPMPQSIARDDAVHADPALLDRDLGDLGDMLPNDSCTAMPRELRPSAAACPSRPSRRRARARRGGAACPSASSAPVGDGILPRRGRELVDHRLHREGGVRVADRAPPEHRHAVFGECRATKWCGVPST